MQWNLEVIETEGAGRHTMTDAFCLPFLFVIKTLSVNVYISFYEKQNKKGQ